MVFPHNLLAFLSLRIVAGMVLYLTVVASAQADVVLMHNGSLLEGVARQENDAVFVSGPGSEIRLREADVAAIVGTPQEAYQWLRNRRDVAARTANDCLGLAEWCLRQGMWPEASQELVDARRLAPQSERVALIERRLKMLTQESSIQKNPVQLVSAEEPLLDRPAEEPSPNKTFRLPPGGLEHFTRRIQPLLVNNCTTSGCHACNGKDQLKLDRRLLHGYANARSTQQNLRSILAAIDIENPKESPLLIAARGPHHKVMPLQGNRRDDWLARLEAWITAVAAAQPRAMEETVAVESGVIQASHEESIEETITAEVVEKLRPAKLAVGGVLTPIEPRDEFDPEIFNRKYRRPEDDLPIGPAGH